MKINNFQGELPDISAKKEALSKTLQTQPADEAYDIIWQHYMSVKFAKRANV